MAEGRIHERVPESEPEINPSRDHVERARDRERTHIPLVYPVRGDASRHTTPRYRTTGKASVAEQGLLRCWSHQCGTVRGSTQWRGGENKGTSSRMESFRRWKSWLRRFLPCAANASLSPASSSSPVPRTRVAGWLADRTALVCEEAWSRGRTCAPLAFLRVLRLPFLPSCRMPCLLLHTQLTLYPHNLGALANAALPRSPVRIRTISSTGKMRMTPSPTRPVRAAFLIASDTCMAL